MSQEPRLSFVINNTQPVELLDLTRSFMSVADEYRRYIQRNGERSCADDIRLYVKEIRSGSIITDLVALSCAGLPYIENALTVVSFSEYLHSAYEFFKGFGKKPGEIERVNYENLSNIIDPVAKDNASQLNISTVVNGDVNLVFKMDSLEANAAQNHIARVLRSMKEPTSGFHDNVVMYWYQARNDPSGSVGDRAIIESIHRSPVKTIFAFPELKAKMLLDPFSSAYLVDVHVETVEERPVLYKVTAINDKIEMPIRGSR